MLIRKIEIVNFRQYKGTNTLEFSTDPIKNVTVIMGDNGSGKTTLAQAFTWCLYGIHDFKVKELINREVRDHMIPGDKAEVSVALSVYENNEENRIVRKNLYIRTNSKVEVQSSSFTVGIKNQQTGEFLFEEDKKSSLMVKNMLPSELSRFFIFDGERMDAMSKDLEGGKSKDFAEAVHGIVGQTSLRNAISHFKPSVTGTVIQKIEKRIHEQGGSRSMDYTQKINEKNETIENAKKELDGIESQYKFYVEMEVECEKKILEMSSQIQLKQDYEKMKSELSKLESEKNKSIQALFQYFSNETAHYMQQPLAQEALKELKTTGNLDKGIPKLHQDTIKFLLKRKKCLCGQELQDGSEEVQELYKLLEIALPKSLSQYFSDFIQKMKSNSKTASQYHATLQLYLKSIADKERHIQKLVTDIQTTYELLTDTSSAKTLQEQKDYARKQQENIKKKEKELQGIITIAEKDKGYLEAEREKFVVLNEQNRKNKRYLAYAYFIYENMVKEYAENETKARMGLEKEINDVFNRIYEGGLSISVDEKYNIKVHVDDLTSSGDELEKNTAQNYAIIFAFITGIISMARKKQEEYDQLYEREVDRREDGYPLIMDAPLSAFDKTRIEKICSTIPGIAKQIIMFIKDTDGSVAEQYMSSKIGRKHSIIARSQTETVVERRD